MNCKELRPQLPAYCLGELDDELRRGLEAHLATCQDCRREGDVISRTLADLGHWQELAPSENRRRLAVERMTVAYAAGLARREKWRARLRRQRGLVWGAAAMALVAVALGFLLLSLSEEDGRELAPRPGAAYALRIAQMTGVVELRCVSSASEQWTPARVGQILRPGLELRTGPDSMAVLRSSVGDRLLMDYSTQLRPEGRTSGGDEVIFFEYGHLRIVAVPRTQGRLVFRTPNGEEARVVGTDFDLTLR